MELPTLIGRTSLFPILGVLGGILHFIPNFDWTFASFQALKPEPVKTPCSVASDLGLYCFHMPLKDASLGCVKVPLPYSVILKDLNFHCKDIQKGYQWLGSSFDHKLHNALCGISSGSSLFAKVSACRYPEWKWFVASVTHSQFCLQ